MPYTKILLLNDGKFTISMLILLLDHDTLNLTEMREHLNVKSAGGVMRSKYILKELGLIKEEVMIPNQYRITLTEKGRMVAETFNLLKEQLQ